MKTAIELLAEAEDNIEQRSYLSRKLTNIMIDYGRQVGVLGWTEYLIRQAIDANRAEISAIRNKPVAVNVEPMPKSEQYFKSLDMNLLIDAARTVAPHDMAVLLKVMAERLEDALEEADAMRRDTSSYEFEGSDA
jgi:hypothetical protein